MIKISNIKKIIIFALLWIITLSLNSLIQLKYIGSSFLIGQEAVISFFINEKEELFSFYLKSDNTKKCEECPLIIRNESYDIMLNSNLSDDLNINLNCMIYRDSTAYKIQINNATINYEIHKLNNKSLEYYFEGKSNILESKQLSLINNQIHYHN